MRTTKNLYWEKSAVMSEFENTNKRRKTGSAFHEAAYCNDLSQVTRILAEVGDVNMRNCDRRTPLHWAAIGNENASHFMVIELLLKKGADSNAEDKYGQTPFYLLARKGNLKIVRLFLKFKADINVIDKVQGRNLLFPVVESNENLEVLELLISLGLDIDHRDENGNTPLYCALNFGITKCMNKIKILLKNGADLNEDLNADDPLYRSLVFKAIDARIEKYIRLHKIDGCIQKNDFNFIMEHIDFNLKDYQLISTVRSCFFTVMDDVWKWFLEHIAKLQSLNITVHLAVLNIISQIEKYNDYFNDCKAELLRAKNSNLKNSWITYYNFLVDSKRKLKNYAGNQDMVKGLKKKDFEAKFPIYGTLVSEKLQKGIRRRKLFDEASIKLSDCLPLFNPNHLIIRDILDYVISKKDLTKFCN